MLSPSVPGPQLHFLVYLTIKRQNRINDKIIKKILNVLQCI